MFDARENLRSAILRNRIRVEEINLVLNRSAPTTPSNRGRRRLIEEKLHLEQCIAELQVELQSKDRHEAERLFRWEDLDQRIVSSKTMDIVEDMSERVRTAESKISFETARSGNSSGYVARLLEFHEELTNEWAERLFAVYCEAWREQNRSITPNFIRAIRDRPIRTLFAARKSSVAAHIGSRAFRTGEPMNPGSLTNWNLRMDRLAARWGRRLEAEAAKCEYRAARTQQTEGGDPVAARSQLPDTPRSHRPSAVLPPSSAPRKPGRSPRLAQAFVDFAGGLWLDAKQHNGGTVSAEQLVQIGSQLDARDYVPPSKYLEGKSARDLKAFNSRNSNSKLGPIQTWSQLVASDDKDHLRGMRRLLSRCAEKRDYPDSLSGN